MCGGAQQDRMHPQPQGCGGQYEDMGLGSGKNRDGCQYTEGLDLADDAVFGCKAATPALQHQGGDEHRAHLAW